MEDFIYNQNQIPPTQWRYGFRSSAATGCGWITTYNALWLMGTCEKPETLIQYYQKAFPLVNGNLGTWVLNLIRFFREQGFRVQVVARRSKFDEAVKDGDACILFYWWRKAWKIGTPMLLWLTGTERLPATIRSAIPVDRTAMAPVLRCL